MCSQPLFWECRQAGRLRGLGVDSPYTLLIGALCVAGTRDFPPGGRVVAQHYTERIRSVLPKFGLGRTLRAWVRDLSSRLRTTDFCASQKTHMHEISLNISHFKA